VGEGAFQGLVGAAECWWGFGFGRGERGFVVFFVGAAGGGYAGCVLVCGGVRGGRGGFDGAGRGFGRCGFFGFGFFVGEIGMGRGFFVGGEGDVGAGFEEGFPESRTLPDGGRVGGVVLDDGQDGGCDDAVGAREVVVDFWKGEREGQMCDWLAGWTRDIFGARELGLKSNWLGRTHLGGSV